MPYTSAHDRATIHTCPLSVFLSLALALSLSLSLSRALSLSSRSVRIYIVHTLCIYTYSKCIHTPCTRIYLLEVDTYIHVGCVCVYVCVYIYRGTPLPV